jgi:hypothetical protein
VRQLLTAPMDELNLKLGAGIQNAQVQLDALFNGINPAAVRGELAGALGELATQLLNGDLEGSELTEAAEERISDVFGDVEGQIDAGLNAVFGQRVQLSVLGQFSLGSTYGPPGGYGGGSMQQVYGSNGQYWYIPGPGTGPSGEPVGAFGVSSNLTIQLPNTPGTSSRTLTLIGNMARPVTAIDTWSIEARLQEVFNSNGGSQNWTVKFQQLNQNGAPLQRLQLSSVIQTSTIETSASFFAEDGEFKAASFGGSGEFGPLMINANYMQDEDRKDLSVGADLTLSETLATVRFNKVHDATPGMPVFNGQLVEAALLSHGLSNTVWEDTLFGGAFGEMQVNGVTDQYLRTEMLMPVKKLFPWSPGYVHSTVLIRTGEPPFSDAILLSIPPDTSGNNWDLILQNQLNLMNDEWEPSFVYQFRY